MYQSNNSIVCKIGILVPLDIWVMQPIFPVEIISTGNIGCITQISNGTNIPILHTIELLDWYTGGPKPKILERI